MRALAREIRGHDASASVRCLCKERSVHRPLGPPRMLPIDGRGQGIDVSWIRQTSKFNGPLLIGIEHLECNGNIATVSQNLREQVCLQLVMISVVVFLTEQD